MNTSNTDTKINDQIKTSDIRGYTTHRHSLFPHGTIYPETALFNRTLEYVSSGSTCVTKSATSTHRVVHENIH